MLRRWKPVESIDALGGDGVIAGEMSGDPEVQDGLLTVNGVPASRQIEVRERKTRRVVAVRHSQADGTYRFPGLNPALQYDVIARDFAGDYEDVIAGAVRPHTPDLMVPVTAGDKMAAFSDPYGGNVVSLLHFDVPAYGGLYISETGHIWRSVGGASISTSQFKFGGASLSLPGDAALLSSSADFAFFNLDFTCEMFLRLPSTGGINNNIFYFGAFGDYSDPPSGLYVDASGAIRYWGNGSDRIVGSVVTGLAFRHIAISRQDGVARLFVDGTLQGSWSDGVNYGGSYVKLGRFASVNYIKASHIDELRITKGVARYTANFTPPTAPFEL